MIPKVVARQIKRLLQEASYSQRQIARATGASRATVSAIASGRRRVDDQPPRGPQMELGRPSGPRRRCGGCGGLVYMPCRLCGVRKLLAESPLNRLPPGPAEPVRIELRGEHRVRYEQVRLQLSRSPWRRGGK